MIRTDFRDVPVSTDSQRAMDLFETALIQYHSYFGDPVETIEQALEEQPDFVLGHIFRATLFLTMAEGRFQNEIELSLQRARRLFSRANERERGLLVAAERCARGDWSGACNAWEQVLIQHPRDAFALQSAHLMDFYRGDAVNLRDRPARVLSQYDADTPSYSYLVGLHAFGLEECNHYRRAEERAREALALQPRDPWAIHAAAHVMEMQNRYDEGIDWYLSREADWAPDNALAIHNWWHLGVYHMERAEYGRALELFDERIYPQPAEFLLALVDATSFLWRLQLQGVDIGRRWEGVADRWQEQAEAERGFYAFNDWHAMMAYVGSGRSEVAERLLADMKDTAETGTTINAGMTAEVGLPVARAVRAFGRGDYAATLHELYPVRTGANRFGGSNAQRDALNQTLIVAAIRAGRRDTAKALLDERLDHKPHSPLAWRFQAAAAQTAGNPEAARRHRARARQLVAARPRAA